MSRLRYLFAACVGLALTYACASDDDPNSGNTGALVDPACADESNPPSSLACTGLYSDIHSKNIANGVHAYTPAVPLWSDGAEKSRWIQLPAGTTIDASDPSEWRFPIGTKAWKEFRVGNKRVETRLWQKVSATNWVNATYAWNADETAATISPGGDIQLADGAKYHIPTTTECQQCHRGRTDRLLGFESVSLGLDGASGWTLRELVDAKVISPAPANAHLVLGDDGTTRAAAAMSWLHVNCGVTCHNTNSSSIGYAAKMNLRLDPLLLDGRPSTDFAARTTTLGITAVTPQWAGATRIAAGDPDDSLLVQLISRRESNNQMPPIATSVVDPEHVAAVRAWIAAMAPFDAGAEDAGIDDAGITDAGDAGSEDGSIDGGVESGFIDASSDGAAGSLCEPGSIEESEPNDTDITADVLPSQTAKYCGRVQPNDVDYVTFTLPANATTFGIFQSNTSTALKIEGVVDGTTFALDGSNPPFMPGKTYLLKATAPGAGVAVDYSVSISIGP